MLCDIAKVLYDVAKQVNKIPHTISFHPSTMALTKQVQNEILENSREF